MLVYSTSTLRPLTAERKQKGTNVACASWKTKQSGCFLWILRQIQQNALCNNTTKHQTNQWPKFTTEWYRKTPVATVQTVSVSASLSVHALGGGEGLPPPFTKLCQIQNKHRARGETSHSSTSCLTALDIKPFLQGNVPRSVTHRLYNFHTSVCS